VLALAAGAGIGPSIGLRDAWPSLFVIASFVALYNLIFQHLLQRAGPRMPLRRTTIALMCLDLASLLATVHFTGGLQSPVLPMFVLHMAIGTIMIAARFMYALAGLSSAALVGLFLLELRGVVQFHPLAGQPMPDPGPALLNLLAISFVLLGVVYLTDSVNRRFKQRNIELHHTSRQLLDRTAQLRHVVREMRALERRKSHYMRISAHQLRSPLGTIRTSLQVLADGFADPRSERGRRLLAGAVERADALLEIVNGLLELAKVREGRARAQRVANLSVNQLLADLADTLEVLAEERGVEITTDLRAPALLESGISADLVYAFENVLENAVKYSEKGDTVAVLLDVTPDDRARIVVRDEGIGIPDGFLADVFLEFVRAPNARRHVASGSGLGLAIAREVIEAHGGAIAIESAVGEGTTVRIDLPLRGDAARGSDPVSGG
jgi:signal transduction histidine kinase